MYNKKSWRDKRSIHGDLLVVVRLSIVNQIDQLTMATVDALVGAEREDGRRTTINFTKKDLSSALVYANKVQLRNAFFEAFGMSYFTMKNFYS